MCDIKNCELLKLKEDFGLVPEEQMTESDYLDENLNNPSWVNQQFTFDKILVLNRESNQDNAVFGYLYFRGVLIGYTLERFDKIIPSGRYLVKVSYSPKLRRFTPEIVVPNRTGIRIHSGNTIADTRGCILVGMSGSDNVLRYSSVCFDVLLYNIRNCGIDTILITNNF